MKKFKITIPDPCNEDWDKMTPDANGRFCLVCNKSVVDFTNKLPEEIQHFFLKNQGQTICGRFKNSQLDVVSIQIPSQVLFSQTQYHKMFLLALFVIMGTSLFSCATINGNKQKIDKVEVINDTKIQNDIESDSITKNVKKDSNYGVRIGSQNAIMGAIPTITTIHYESFFLPKNENKKIFFSSFFEIKNKNSNNIKKNNLEEAYFPEGIIEFYTFFAEEFYMPENTKVYEIIVMVTITENGSITYIKSSPHINKSVEEEIIRVLKLSPKWQPGKSNGHNISKEYFFGLRILTLK